MTGAGRTMALPREAGRDVAMRARPGHVLVDVALAGRVIGAVRLSLATALDLCRAGQADGWLTLPEPSASIVL